MITAETIRSRLTWAEISEEEAAARFALMMARELEEIPEDEPDRTKKAIRRAVRDLWGTAWRSGCMACLGAEDGGTAIW